ncbi:hypothetical protein [Lentzea sp. NEAU-D7]|uniref:hypothetical protein n=1 Tax=Lentzea sp. NEAU-D7 TaxID=2994667 RepID=UPI00224B273A|nr:hypothetical protein [Lentzea sp. NEAU-D7]MCX2952825.1 hypothetical protein [Lentzea sp. NEAU-D7]
MLVVIVVLVDVIALVSSDVSSQRVVELITIGDVLVAYFTSSLGRRRESGGRR